MPLGAAAIELGWRDARFENDPDASWRRLLPEVALTSALVGLFFPGSLPSLLVTWLLCSLVLLPDLLRLSASTLLWVRGRLSADRRTPSRGDVLSLAGMLYTWLAVAVAVQLCGWSLLGVWSLARRAVDRSSSLVAFLAGLDWSVFLVGMLVVAVMILLPLSMTVRARGTFWDQDLHPFWRLLPHLPAALVWSTLTALVLDAWGEIPGYRSFGLGGSHSELVLFVPLLVGVVLAVT